MLVIPGTGSVAHLEENAAAAALLLESDEVRRLDAA
jgi:aryl-alcohol dehydrogenase-like predicted oxidoreductase